MILAALALFSHAAVHMPPVRPAIAPQTLQWPSVIPSSITTGVRITIGGDGRIERCAVTSSSGLPALDAALCDMLARARLENAGDFHGASGVFSAPDEMDADRRPGTHEISITSTPPRY